MTRSFLNRRRFVQSAVTGSVLFPGIMQQLMAEDADPLAPREPHYPAKAKRVIFLFMTGGVSHVDTFDPKPELTRSHGKEIKADHPEIKGRPGYERIYLKRPQWEFAPHGQCGTEVSSLFPHVATCVDDIALIRSMHTSHSNHYNATLGMHTGSFTQSRAQHRIVDDVRPGYSESQSAWLCRHRATADLCRHAGLCQRLLAGRASWRTGRAGCRTGGQRRPSHPLGSPATGTRRPPDGQ